MRYIDVYRTQLGDDHKKKEAYYHSNIFREYSVLNAFTALNEENKEEVKTRVESVIESFTQESKEALEHKVDILKTQLKKLVKDTDWFSCVDGVIFLIGDASFEAQGMLLYEKSYLVVDMSRYEQEEDRDMCASISFLLKKLIETKHYKLNPKMYLKNKQMDMSNLEEKMNLMVYKICGLTYEQIKDRDSGFDHVLERFYLTKVKYNEMTVEELSRIK